MTKSILVIQELYPEQIENLKETASEYEIIESLVETDPSTIEIILGWSEDLVSFVESDDCNVKWVQYPYAGVNDLPLETFTNKDILLTNGSGITANSVAETTIGLLLGMTRKIVRSASNQKIASWDRGGETYELSDKNIMVVGAGQIGVQVARIAKAFNMHTIGINRSGRPIDHMDEQYIQTELEEVIHKADIVVNILPLTKETTHLYDKGLFEKMKDGVIFINVGRGESVVTDDLITALDQGKVSQAGLDVFEQEPLDVNHPLWKHEKVLMTPHIAGQVESYPKHVYPIFKENLEAFLKGKELPKNQIELSAGY